jgi:hypothetical protein
LTTSPALGFQHLHLELTVVSYIDVAGGHFRIVMRLEAFGLGHLPGRMEILRKTYRMENGSLVPVWHESERELSPHEAARLALSLRALKNPRVQCRPTGATAWDGVTLAVSLDGSTWILRLNPTDGIEGGDAAAVRDLFRDLGRVAGLTVQDGYPDDFAKP